MSFSDIALGFGVIAGLLMGIAFVAWVFVSGFEDYFKDREERERRSKFKETIASGLKNETIRTVDDFTLVFRGIFQLGSDDQLFPGEMPRLLREYLASSFTDAALNAEEVRRIKDIIADALAALERRAPFSDVPGTERNLLLDAVGFLRAGDEDAAGRKLEQLASCIVLRKEEVERLQRSNRWATRLAVVGLILTLLLGIASLLLTVKPVH